ncbi:MAG TPA: hypothetical protein PK473_03240 [Nitrosomonas sp.]|nr:hypothetical protein [Nitrosomonas sp.]
MAGDVTTSKNNTPVPPPPERPQEIVTPDILQTTGSQKPKDKHYLK